MRVLRLQDRGSEVRQLQLLLNSARARTKVLRADGSFGPNTDRAVRAFQKSKGLTEDGVVGRATWAAFDIRIRSTSGFHVGFFHAGNAERFDMFGGNQANAVKLKARRRADYESVWFRWP